MRVFSPKVEADMAINKVYRLFLVMAAFGVLAACSSTGSSDERNDRLESVGSNILANPERCVLIPERLSVSRLPPAAVEDFLINDNGGEIGWINLRRVLAIKGECLDAIVGYQAGSAYLDDGRILVMEPHPKLAPDDYKYVEPSLTSLPISKADPNFVMADRIVYLQGEPRTAQVLAGLWTDSEGSTIRVLRINENGQVDGSKVLLRSLRPVQSLRYLLGPDMPSGTLFLTIRQDDSLLLASLDFIHPDWAATFGK